MGKPAMALSRVVVPLLVSVAERGFPCMKNLDGEGSAGEDDIAGHSFGGEVRPRTGCSGEDESTIGSATAMMAERQRMGRRVRFALQPWRSTTLFNLRYSDSCCYSREPLVPLCR